MRRRCMTFPSHFGRIDTNVQKTGKIRSKLRTDFVFLQGKEPRSMTKEELLEKAKLLPLTPGVYLMRNKAGTVIYVGKSKALRNRVSSYFSPSVPHYGKTEKMIRSVDDFEVYHTATELEALLQENAFIKQYMPRYNIKLKDSDAYPYIRISKGEYPNLSVVYSRTEGNHRYFGPFSSAHVANEIVATAAKTFGLPTCKKSFPEDIGKGRPCLQYHIGGCCGLCIKGQVSPEEYRALASGAEQLLKGDYAGLLKELTLQMEQASEAEQYERAANFRDRIRAVKKVGDKQQIVAAPDVEADIFGVYRDDLGSAVSLLFVRNGAISDRVSFFFGADEILDREAWEGLLQRIYQARGFVPGKICLPEELTEEGMSLLSGWLAGKAGIKVQVYCPQRGEFRALTDRASENAKQLLLHKRAEEEKQNDFLVSFAKFLCMEVIPQRIESYDISHSGGEHPTCGMVVLENGKFAKRKYRTFHIKEGDGNNDIASLTEALTRRFGHDDAKQGWEHPDLILMDGGVAQVNAAKAVLAEKGLSIPVFGMVKDAFHKTRTLTDGENELSLNKRQDLFVFLYKLQEEVHRFALSRMDLQRRKTVKRSDLVNIKGVGEAKAKALLMHFETYERLKQATVEELCEVKGINPATAMNIYDYFKEK